MYFFQLKRDFEIELFLFSLKLIEEFIMNILLLSILNSSTNIRPYSTNTLVESHKIIEYCKAKVATKR